MTSIKVRVIFIASLSHSGSTLLDLMLNAHPELVSVGELKQLSRYARFNKPNKLDALAENYRCGTATFGNPSMMSLIEFQERP